MSLKPSPPERTSFWKSTAGMLTALGTFIAAIGTLVGALAAAGVLRQNNPPPPGSSSIASSSSISSSISSSPEPTAEHASIDLLYRGDRYGCALYLIVQVGSQSAEPSGSRFTMQNVETGVQKYAIRGSITCPTVGQCSARGSGSIDVAEGHSYAIVWLNTGVGNCDVTLQ